MSKKLLIVIDMQEDFTYGALRNEEAIRIIPNVVEKVKQYEGAVIFTRDTHEADYMTTQEGRKLPVPHCIRSTPGWELVEPLAALCREKGCRVVDKPTFGSVRLAQELAAENAVQPFDEIELVGVCTDICVISNAMLVKAAMPEVTIKVDPACCAGVTVQSHDTALAAMRACQIEVK